jgi:hypothetical protein
MMKDFPSSLCNLAAVTMLLGMFAPVTGAEAGVIGGRTGGLRSYEQARAVDSTAAIPVTRKGQIAGNCVMTSADRVVGAQRVWTQHGVITVGGHVERIPSTECR